MYMVYLNNQVFSVHNSVNAEDIQCSYSVNAASTKIANAEDIQSSYSVNAAFTENS